jgi:hypothetical protein
MELFGHGKVTDASGVGRYIGGPTHPSTPDVTVKRQTHIDPHGS